MTLETLFIQEIQKKGDLSFIEFMEQALYHPVFGYYTSELPKFGKRGDFITAPELTPLFGQTLSLQFQPILKEMSAPVLLEFGAGSGRLCVDILKSLEEARALPQRYLIFEVSPALAQRQSDLIQQEIPGLATKVEWLETWPKEPLEGIFFANEVLDAMPVHRFLKTENALLESFISLDQNSKLQEIFKPCQNAALSHYLEKNLAQDLPKPYLSEVNLNLAPWMKQAAKALKKGVFFFIDYGFPRHTYYHPERSMGTLICHHQHRSHGHFLHELGQQDLSVHVDFTYLAEQALEEGFELAGYTSQASFLLANGLLNLLEACNKGDQTSAFQATQAVKRLVQPQEMGELFKVMALSKDFYLPLSGFQLNDKRMSL